MSKKGEELMGMSVDLKGVSVGDVAGTILSYVENVRVEREAGILRKDGGPHSHVSHFIQYWHEANQNLEEDLRDLVSKHFGTELPKR